MIGTHVRERLATRVDAGERASVEAAINATMVACERQGVTEAAVRVWRAASKQHSNDGSNGECAVLLVRTGYVLDEYADCYHMTERTNAVSLMWRRATQPHTARAYRVAKVMCVKGTCTTHEHREHR